MKKLILFVAILFAGVSVVNAQDISTVEKQTEATVNLSVTLKNIQYIEVSNQPSVNLSYNTIETYTNGVSSDFIDNHLTVSSAGSFTVNVKAADLKNGKDNIIAASTIQIEAKKGTNGLENGYTSKFALANSDQPLITSTQGGINKQISVNYHGAGADAYVSNFTNDEGEAIYTTIVYYTILAN